MPISGEKELLEVNNIAVNYGENRALKSISVQVGQGEIVAMIGANGAGKSTTLKAISGIVKIARGEVLFKGKVISKWSPSQIVRAGVSQCPEGRQLWPDMTVTETLEMGAYIRTDRKATLRDMDEVMALFPILAERRSQLAGSLSGGEQQALAIARALMAKPQLILFDEPSLGLAPMLVEGILKSIQKLRSEGLTVLLVEQNAHAALQVADRAYVLEKGEISLQGKASDLLNNDDVRRVYLGM